MADQLATPADLAALLQQDLDASTATVVLEAATAVVQGAAGGQRIIAVADDTFDITGTAGSWLQLPQVPVTSVTAVELDGEALTDGEDYRRRGDRLWRTCGWAACPSEPSTVTGTYGHGYADDDWRIGFARSSVLMLAAGIYTNPGQATQERIDDYSVMYEAASAALEKAPHLKAALRRQYGRRGGLVTLG